MANRTTVKSNVQTKNVPTVTNAILTDILNSEMCDNVRFREDVAVIQNAVTSAISVDFTDKERVDLQRTGGSLNITVSGIGDGETKFLLVTKTAGQAVTWVGVTDVTPVKQNADALSLVLYEIVRKGSNFFAKAWVETVVQATSNNPGVMKIATYAQNLALANQDSCCVPGLLPLTSETQQGLSRLATAGEIAAGSSGMAVQPSQMKTANDNLLKDRLYATRIIFGQFNAAGTDIALYGGTLPAISINILGTGYYRITHNIGHTRYIILGVAPSVSAVSLRANINLANTCEITTSDDAGYNNSSQNFVMIIWD
jgi:hypothetical protein